MLSVTLTKLLLLGALFSSVVTSIIHNETEVSSPEIPEPEYQSWVRVRKSNPLPVDIERADQLMTALFQNLHSFINETSFDHNRFREQYPSLDSDFNRIATLVNRLRDPNHRLTHLMNFSRQLLGVMRAAQETMDRAELLDLEGPYYCLMYDASELRVMTMDLLNDIGHASFTDQQLQGRIRGFLRRSAELEMEFHGFSFIPLNVRMVAWNDLWHSNSMLQTLRSRWGP